MAESTRKYSEIMPKKLNSHMSKAEIQSISDEVVSTIAGKDASLRYIAALKKSIAPLLTGYIQAIRSTCFSLSLL